MLPCCAVLGLVTTAFADADADALARKVAEAAGDPYALSSLEFTFVVQAGEQEKARRSHSWQPQAGTLTVTVGGSSVQFEALGETDPTAFVDDPSAHASDWARVAPGTEPPRAAEAWRAFLNDSYWLLAPAKVMDEGVRRSLDEEGRLLLSFDGVGVTPGDLYVLTIDAESSRVLEWSFVLESGRASQFSWSAPDAAGPLMISQTRTSPDGDFVVRFEDIHATP